MENLKTPDMEKLLYQTIPFLARLCLCLESEFKDF